MGEGDEKNLLEIYSIEVRVVDREKIRELLQKLVQVIRETISKGLAKKTLQPHYMRYFRWKLTKFEERDNGTIDWSSEGEEFLKPFWGKAANDVFHKVCKLDIYSDTYKAVSEDYNLGEGQTNLYLHQLIMRLATNILVRKVKTVADTTKYIDSFLKDLNGEKRAYRAEVQLQGIALQPKSIKLDEGVKLRKPNRKDFEREVFVTFPSHGTRPLRNPTAFLHTRIYAIEEGVPLQNEIDREVTILRLYRVGAVQAIQYSMDSDSIISSGVSTITAGKMLGSDKYLVTKQGVKLLKKFWVNMKKVELPSSVYVGTQKEPDELSIAYDRYNDSLETHILEKRISSAVMGLEALYLSPSERQELTFKLSMRVGKLLSQIGYSAEKVRKELTHAYDIRSTYVHGKTLTQKQKNRHEKEVGELGQFSKVVMDYLRASIVAWLERPSKTSLIQKIDDSFLDSKKEEEIKKLLFMP